MHATLCLFDRTEAVFAWSAIDDRVMGDVTHGAVRFGPADHAVFSGQVAPDNNAGFASVRALVSPVTAGEIDAIEPAVRGDGRRYKLNLRINRGFDGVNYQAVLTPPLLSRPLFVGVRLRFVWTAGTRKEAGPGAGTGTLRNTAYPNALAIPSSPGEGGP